MSQKNQLLVLGALVLLLLTSTSIFSQGSVRGVVTDGNDGQTLPFVNIIIKGTTIGVNTDLNGGFSLENVPFGEHTLVASFIGYTPVEKNIEITSSKVLIVDMVLGVNPIMVGPAVIQERIDRSDAVGIRKIDSPTSFDYFSRKQISKTGDGTADEAFKRIPGVSTVGNFVFVRGLSDRYLKTTLNGAQVPSINPRRNSLEMDIFPTNLIDNLIVVKTQMASLPSDWSGAYLDIQTRDFPNEFSFQYQVSLGYNENASNQNIITSQRSATDWAGYDDGMRSIPNSTLERLDNYPTIEEVCFYDALVFGGFEEDLSQLGISECSDIGPLGVMSIEDIIDDIEQLESTEQLINDYLKPLGEERNQDLSTIGQDFQNSWENERRNAPLDMSHNISFGNRGKLFGRPLGYLFGAQYSRSTRYYNDGEYGRYANGIPEISDSLTVQKSFSDERSFEKVYWNALLSLSMQLNEFNQVSVMAMPNVSGNNTSRYQSGINPKDTEDFQEQRTQRYSERNMNIFQLKGEHLLPLNKWKISWTSSYSNGILKTPDLKVFYSNFRYQTERSFLDDQGVDITEQVLEAIDELVDDGAISGANDPDLADELLSEYDLVLGSINEEVVDTAYTIEPSLYPAPTRFFRTLKETNWDTKVHLEIPLGSDINKKNKLQFGLSYVKATRRHTENTFSVASQGLAFDGDLVDYFGSNNFQIIPNQDYLYTQNLTDLINTDRGEQIVYGAYAMTDVYLKHRIHLNAGIRAEKAEMFIRSDKATAPGSEELTPEQLQSLEGTLDELDVLPSINLIWQLNEKDTVNYKVTNLRFSYSRTLARPVFREKSPFRGFDFETLETLKGNPLLDATKVDNLDLKIEHFPRGGNSASLAIFYKRFTDPIEQQAVQEALNTEITWVNVPYANVIGAEFEFTQNLGFINPKLKSLSIGTNLTIIRSRTRIFEEELLLIRKSDPQHEEVRPLYGQSPYIINSILSYSNDSIGFKCAVSFNVQGEKLILVTKGGTPDIYQQPFPSLDLTVRQLIKKRFQLGFKAQNILAPDNRKIYRYKDIEYDWNSYNLGRNYSLSLAYRIG